MARLTSAVLQTNPVLERAIAEDPFDEERWIVLEDWLLEQNDPRAILVRLEKAGRTAGALRVRRRLHYQLFGNDHAAIAPLVFAGNWRAGYIREFHFASHIVEPLLALSFAPATRLCRALTLSVPRTHVTAALGHMQVGLAHVLSELTISNPHVEAPLLTPASLAPFPRLGRLALRGAYFDAPGEVPRISSLLLAPTRSDHVRLPALLEAMTFPDVRELVLDLANLGSLDGISAVTPASLAPVLERKFAARLERFEIRNAPEPLSPATLEALAASRL